MGLGDGSAENMSNALPVPGLTGIQFVALGNQNTCAVTADNGMVCWGDNSFAEFGVDPAVTSQSITPLEIDLPKPVSKIYAYNSNYCAVALDGSVLCWGNDVFPPAPVPGLTSGFVKVAPGNWHSCALNTAGEVYCWGDNDYGQLGVGAGDHAAPVKLYFPGKVVDIASGDRFSCAVQENGSVWCWGRDTNGQVGADNPGVIEFFPILLNGISSARYIYAGFQHACAITNSDVMYCWGQNNFAQLGAGDFQDSNTPRLANIKSLHPISADLGNAHTCILEQNGKVFCWGSNINGQVGDSAPLKYMIPATANGFESGASTSPTALAQGMNNSCALKADGTAYCWGMNTAGELGGQTLISSAEPVQVQAGTTRFSAITAGQFFSCGLTTQGGVKCWGKGSQGQLGNDSNEPSLVPVDVIGLGTGAGVTSLMSDRSHSCALLSTGELQCWGAGEFIPFTLFDSGVVEIASGRNEDVSCARFSNGSVQCWTQTFEPFGVSGFESGVQQISMMFNKLCALKANSVVCNDDVTQVPGTTYTVQNIQRSDVVKFAAGWEHYCYLDINGGVKCAGGNQFGQLGDGTTTSHDVPATSTGLSTGVTALSTHWNRVCAVKNGAMYCWGDASKGALGDGLPLYRTFPVEVDGLQPNPVMRVNYPTAKPGSKLRIVGSNFAPEARFDIQVNGKVLGQVKTNRYGIFMVLIDTKLADDGIYDLDALPVDPSTGGSSVFSAILSAAPAASEKFTLSSALQIQPKEGSAIILNVPSSIGFTDFIFLPSLSR